MRTYSQQSDAQTNGVRALLCNEGFDEHDTNETLGDDLASDSDLRRKFVFFHQKIVDHRRHCEDEFPNIATSPDNSGDNDDADPILMWPEDSISFVSFRPPLLCEPPGDTKRDCGNFRKDAPDAKRARFEDATDYVLQCVSHIQHFDMEVFRALKQRDGDPILDPLALINGYFERTAMYARASVKLEEERAEGEVMRAERACFLARGLVEFEEGCARRRVESEQVCTRIRTEGEQVCTRIRAEAEAERVRSRAEAKARHTEGARIKAETEANRVRLRAEAKARHTEGARIKAETEANRVRLRVEGARLRTEADAERARSRAEKQAKCALQKEEGGDKRAIQEQQILRLKLIEDAQSSTLPYLDFLSCIQKRKKSNSSAVKPIVVQAIGKVFPDNNCPLTSILMFKLNKLVQYLMHSTQGRHYRFQFKGRIFYCKEGPCRFVCATDLPNQVLRDLVRGADANPASSTWPTNTEGLTKIKAPSDKTLWQKWIANQSRGGAGHTEGEA
jgi:hypothetical protein